MSDLAMRANPRAVYMNAHERAGKVVRGVVEQHHVEGAGRHRGGQPHAFISLTTVSVHQERPSAPGGSHEAAGSRLGEAKVGVSLVDGA